ncbi:LuxR C-terminal-related transcriptional regulator [Streptomyces polyrhachis]|uniref:LuxR C-terminal-related transcriptional regulator n=1 Tax=Streptomyces polyrhachis TaxID=1282885 RepID=A0ABW2G993_9ACTN
MTDREGGTSKVLVLLDELTPSAALRLLTAGAAGVLRRDTAARHLPWAVTAVAAGSVALAPEITPALAAKQLRPWRASREQAAARVRIAALSCREREVLGLLADGLSNADVAEELTLSDHTVKDHIRAIYGKLGVDNRVQAAQVSWQAGTRDPAPHHAVPAALSRT